MKSSITFRSLPMFLATALTLVLANCNSGPPPPPNTSNPCRADYTGGAPSTDQCLVCGGPSCARCCGYGAPPTCGAACDARYGAIIHEEPLASIGGAGMGGSAALGSGGGGISSRHNSGANNSANRILSYVPDEVEAIFADAHLTAELTGFFNWAYAVDGPLMIAALNSMSADDWNTLLPTLQYRVPQIPAETETYLHAWNLPNTTINRYRVYSSWMYQWIYLP